MARAYDENKHIAVFPFPYSSHPFPLLNLVVKLAHAAPNVSFSFIGLQNNNQTLFSKLDTIPNNLKYYNLSDGVGNKAVKDPIEEVNLFLQTGPENFQKGIDLAVAETKEAVTCILADAFVTPTFALSKTLNIPWIGVWIPMSCSLSVHLYGDMIREWCANAKTKSNEVETKTLDFLPGLHFIRVEDLPHDILLSGTEKETELTRALVSLARVLPQAEAVVVNFFEELDPPVFVEDMRSKLKSMLYVPDTLTTTSYDDDDETGCISWLNKQRPKSVVYVSFGSTVIIPPPHELVALAEALEESEFPFIWSLKEDLKGFLPKGFLERTNVRQGIVLPWAPQAQILAHVAVGVFVTQGGCNSVMEGMSNGVPMICRPFFADQGINSRLVQDVWGNGKIIEGKVFDRDVLVKSFKRIVGKEEGNRFRENGLKLRKILQHAAGPEGRAAKDFKTLLELLISS